MSEKLVFECDLCGEKICDAKHAPNRHNDALRIPGPKDGYQLFEDLDNIDRHICYSCCFMLDNARRLGFIEYPWMKRRDDGAK